LDLSHKAYCEKFYCNLAAAINLRTYIEAIERDRRVFVARQEAADSENAASLQVPGPDENSVRHLFEAIVSGGGDHA
jgi:hypothetical protein